jgi:Divergent InlB B-repeat domain
MRNNSPLPPHTPDQPVGCGSIFKLDPSTGTLSVLYSFSGGVDLGWPGAGLAVDPSGNLYGIALSTIFKLDPLGTPNYVLTILNRTRIAGSFTVNGVACGSICSEFFPKGTAVTLTAVPAAGNTFTGWLAPCSGTGTGACNLTMNSAHFVFGNFAALPPDFSLSASAGLRRYQSRRYCHLQPQTLRCRRLCPHQSQSQPIHHRQSFAG